MLDRRKFVVFIIAGIAAVSVIAIAVVFMLMGGRIGSGINRLGIGTAPSLGASSTEGPNATPTAADLSPEMTDLFGKESLDLARSAAEAASYWRSPMPVEERVARYKKAGLSPALAQSYLPVWSGIFKDGSAAEILSTAEGQVTVEEVRGEAGKYVWRVAVPVETRGTWQSNGKDRSMGYRTLTWWLTIDQATKSVIAIDQPTEADLAIKDEER